jgi:gas vesicle protein GvpG
VIILDTLLIGGIKFVLRRLAEAVDAQMNDVDAIRQELLAAQMRLELGEMSEAEFAALERDLLARMREIRARLDEESAASGPVRITGIDVSVSDDAEGGSADPRR